MRREWKLVCTWQKKIMMRGQIFWTVAGVGVPLAKVLEEDEIFCKDNVHQLDALVGCHWDVGLVGELIEIVDGSEN